VFIDYQNVYGTARETFHPLHAPYTAGQIDPLRLGELLAAKSPYDRELAEVRVYRGQPDSTKDPKGYGASSRQHAAWRANPKTTVITRTLRYPRNWPRERAEEKGIDVALAVDFVVMAVRGEYDVGILMSVDTDLKPALEAVADLKGAPYPRAEVAAWSAPNQHSRRLSIRTAKLWCHWLGPTDFTACADPTDYVRP
jgi:uncharacterized LabA/DUF88 family protein